MKHFLLLIGIVSVAIGISCDAQSEIAKKSVEKYQTSPTPQVSLTPEDPIDPADIVNADVSQEGPKITIKKITDNTALDCSRYNRVAINVDEKSFVIKGVCKELMINGDRNRVTLSAASEIVLNGYANTVQYSKYPNGKRPFIKDNGGTNTIEKVAAAQTQK
jgi:hypothetical protein